MNLVSQTFWTMGIGTARSHRGVTMVPLVGANVFSADYWLLDQALEQGVLKIRAASAGREGQELRIANQGNSAVLILEGEELDLGERSHVLPISALIGPYSDVRLPAKILETSEGKMKRIQGASPGRVLDPAWPGLPAAHSARAWRGGETLALESPEQIGEPEQMVPDPSGFSPGLEGDVAECVRALPAEDHQRGAVFVVGDRVAGLDLFDRAEIFKEILPKLLRRHAIEAIGFAAKAPTDSHQAVILADVFLHELRQADVAWMPTPGAGMGARIEAAGITGFAVYLDADFMHLRAIPSEGAELAEGRPGISFGRRRTAR